MPERRMIEIVAQYHHEEIKDCLPHIVDPLFRMKIAGFMHNKSIFQEKGSCKPCHGNAFRSFLMSPHCVRVLQSSPNYIQMVASFPQT